MLNQEHRVMRGSREELAGWFPPSRHGPLEPAGEGLPVTDGAEGTLYVHLTFRPGLRSDFASFYHNCFPYDRSDETLRGEIEREWNVFLDNPATLTMVVEDTPRAAPERLVGLAQTVFVTDAFVDHVLKSAPSANGHASRPLPDGSWPLLTIEEVRKANAGCGLTSLTTHWTWAEGSLTCDEQRRVRDFIDRTYRLFYAGYHYKQHLIGGAGEWARDALVSSGFRLLCDYHEYYLEHPPVSPFGQLCLYGLDAARAAVQEGSSASRLFAYIPPRFGLGPNEQELLFHALLGRSDKEIAAWLCITEQAVKMRWRRVFEVVGAVEPSLLPAATNQKRGVEKRTRLLQMIRERPEEIRPVFSLPDINPEP